MKVTARVEGLPAVLATFAGLKQSIINKHGRRAMQKAIRPIARLAKAWAWKRTGLTKKAMGSKVATYGGKVVVGIVGPRTGFAEEIGVRIRGKHKGQAIRHDPAKVAHIVEKHDPRLGPAFETLQGQAQQIFEQELLAGLEQEARK